jgi:hypothetical protein
MLVPPGAPEPRVFQRTSPMRHMRYTTDARVFYAAPD